jgi:hypothetical protein
MIFMIYDPFYNLMWLFYLNGLFLFNFYFFIYIEFINN